MVSNEEICDILKTTDRENAAQTLLQKALESGGKDNITLILLYANKERNSFLNKIFKR